MFLAHLPGALHLCYYSSNLDTLGDGDQSSGQVLHNDCNSLASDSHLRIGIHYTEAVRQAGSITLLQGLHHHMHVAAQKYGLSLGMYDLEWKSIYLLFLYYFDSHIQVGQTQGFICSHLTPNRELCLMAHQQVGYSWPIQWSWQPIYLTLFHHVYDSIYGQCARVTSTQDPKSVGSGITRATWSSS